MIVSSVVFTRLLETSINWSSLLSSWSHVTTLSAEEWEDPRVLCHCSRACRELWLKELGPKD